MCYWIALCRCKTSRQQRSSRVPWGEVVHGGEGYKLTFICYCTVRPNLSSFLPESDYVTFRSFLSQICLSSVTFVCPTPGVQTFGNISLPFCTLAILWPPCKEVIPAEPFRRAIKHKRGGEIEWLWTYRRLYLIPVSCLSISSPDEFLVSTFKASLVAFTYVHV